MVAWPGKYVIGLTGNIATGKSVVRKMLEHLGAYGVDADALAHRAIARGAPGYKPVVIAFGKWVLDPDGQIDRSRLGRLVFSDPQALKQLEAIIHPLVRQAVDLLVRRSKHKVVVIEAIKLLEGELRSACDTIWVADAPREVQIQRLVEKRGMDEEAARQRIDTQPDQAQKLAAADVVIRNEGSFEDTWRQVAEAWKNVVSAIGIPPEKEVVAEEGGMTVERARPRQADQIADFINSVSKGRTNFSSEDIMAAFGEKAFLLLMRNTRIIGSIGWQVENLVARTSDVYLQPGMSLADSMRLLLGEVERASRELQCEASLLFLPPHLARQNNVWRSLGYELSAVQSLAVRAWQEAASDSMPTGTVLLFKQLRKDRVLQPI
jgi:dephospho-CoA kinase